MGEDESLKKQLKDLSEKVGLLVDLTHKQEKRLADLEESVMANNSMGMSLKRESDLFAPKPPKDYVTMEKGRTMDSIQQSDKGDVTAAHRSDSESLEHLIGTKWFAWIGITVLLLGIAFFVKYAFDNDWITESARVMIGVILGFGLLALGEKLKMNYRQYSAYLTGGGFVTLYISVFGAYNLYELIPYFVAFALMLVVTIAAILVALRENAQLVMGVATTGAFMTPLVLQTNNSNIPGFLLYVSCVIIATLVVVYLKGWQWLGWVGFVGGFLLFSMVMAGSNRQQYELWLLATYSLYWMSFSVLPLVIMERFEPSVKVGNQALTILAGVIYGWWMQVLFANESVWLRGGLMLVAAVFYFGLSYVIKFLHQVGDKNAWISLYVFMGMAYVTMAVPVLFDGALITYTWLGLAVVSLYMAVMSRQQSWITVSFIILVLGYVRLLFDTSVSDSEVQMVVLNEQFGLTAFAVVITVLEGYLLRYVQPVNLWSEIEKNQKQLIVGFMLMAHFLSVWGVSREIVRYFDNQMRVVIYDQRYTRNSLRGDSDMAIPAYRKPAATGAPSNLIRPTVDQKRIRDLEYRSSISLSIFWLLYGVGLIVGGVQFKHRYLRLAGMALLLVAVVKLFLVDLWSLGTLYRIISSILMGIVLLSVSFNYHRYKEKVEEMLIN